MYIRVTSVRLLNEVCSTSENVYLLGGKVVTVGKVSGYRKCSEAWYVINWLVFATVA